SKHASKLIVTRSAARFRRPDGAPCVLKDSRARQRLSEAEGVLALRSTMQNLVTRSSTLWSMKTLMTRVRLRHYRRQNSIGAPLEKFRFGVSLRGTPGFNRDRRSRSPAFSRI